MLPAGDIMRQITCFLILLLVLGPAAMEAADGGSNLSGTWKMDPSRSESAHQAVPMGSMVLVIKQTPAEISIETRTTADAQTPAQSEVLVYKLNGSETKNALKNQEPVKTKAHWDGRKLITETERSVHEASVTTRYIHSLSANGKELKVEKTLTVQHGYQFEGAKNYGSGTDVFVKSVD
jgi:hypothetical protein